MPVFVINGLAGAGGALVRTLYGFWLAKKREKWSWKRLGGSLVNGFIGGFAIPNPAMAAYGGWMASEVLHKAYRKIKDKKRKLPGNK